MFVLLNLYTARRRALPQGPDHLCTNQTAWDPNVKMVLFEDTAALAGISLAFIGVLADQLTGGLLTGSAAMLAEAAHSVADFAPNQRASLERAIEEFGVVEKVVELLTMVLGPNSLLVAARVDFADGLDDHQVEAVSERIDKRLRDVVPDVTEVFLDATTASPRRTSCGT